MGLSPEQLEQFQTALATNPNLALIKILNEVAKANLNSEFALAKEERMRSADAAGRADELRNGFRAGKLVNEVGKLISLIPNRKLTDQKIDQAIALVNELMDLGELPSNWTERLSAQEA